LGFSSTGGCDFVDDAADLPRRAGSWKLGARRTRTVHRMKFRVFLAAALAWLMVAACAARADTPLYGVEVVRRLPHDSQAFTQGLLYQNGYLYESTGLEGRSSIRRVELETGRVLQQHDIPAQYFGEGIVAWGGKLIELTWRSGVGFVYDLETFALEKQFAYRGEGWGLTHDGRRLIMSDGTPELRFLDPETLQETGRITVTDQGQPVGNLNELEYVRGEVYANVWLTDRIARIDPATGTVTGWIDLTGLLTAADRARGPTDVLNGIAYDAEGDRLFVTGKLWPALFEVRLVRKPG
jgi:glutamine cyclotransferase